MVLVGELAEYHKSDKVHLQVHCIRMTSLFYGWTENLRVDHEYIKLIQEWRITNFAQILAPIFRTKINIYIDTQ